MNALEIIKKMLSKRYSVRIFRPSQVDIVEEFDELNEAKACALKNCRDGYYSVISETLYEYDPARIIDEEEKPTGELPNDKLPWDWLNEVGKY